MEKEKQRKIVTLHQLRERRGSLGELVQADGSPHDWFEGRAPKCTLLVFIDDATGKLLHLELVVSESTASYFLALEQVTWLNCCMVSLLISIRSHLVQGATFQQLNSFLNF